MDKLLAWSIAQQSGDKEAMDKIGQPDMKALSQLFGGVDEPTLMKQAILVAENPEAELNDKEIALENYEMLIENLDNANNIENMKQWPSIIKLLSKETPNSLRVLAASIIGIAVQNNDTSQDNFLKHDHGFESLIENAESNETVTELKLKLLFAISCLVRNNGNALKYFNKLRGWKLFGNSTEKNHKIDIRELSILSSILTNSDSFITEIEPKLHEFKLINTLIAHLTNDNFTCKEKSLSIINQLISLNFKFDDEELKALAVNIKQIEDLRQDYAEEFANIQKVTKSV